MRRILVILACAFAAAAAAEVLLRCAEPPEIYFRTWYKNGIHRPDPVYGFRWTPGYDGHMRHPDGVYAPVPLRLNEYGFRMPVASTNAGPDAPRVLVLGGRSMMFCFGLSDADSIPGRMAAVSPRPVVVQNVTLAGVDLYRNWHLAREQIAAFRPDVILVCMYKQDPAAFLEFAPDFERHPPPPGPEKELFVLWDGIAGGRSPLINRLGRRHDASYVLYGLCNIQDRLLADLSLVKGWVHRRQQEGKTPTPQDASASQSLAAFLRHIAHSPVSGGAAVGVVLLPQRNKPAGLYSGFVRLLPPEMGRIDIHAQLAGELGRLGWIAENHYGPVLATRIARPMVEEALRLHAASGK
jgi:hypothetical protein